VLAGELRPEHIQAVFREFLGRPAAPQDVAAWMRDGSVRRLLDGVLGSEEYRNRLAERERRAQLPSPGSFINCWIPGWESYSRPAGELSPDGVAIVGGGGHLFIYGGSNNNVASHRGEVEMAPGWLESWRVLIAGRLAQARSVDRALAFLVVPEKLAVHGEQFPEDLTARAPRPVLRLLQEGGLPLLYPAESMTAERSGGDTYLRTDSHLTTRGNKLLASITLAALGVDTELLEELDYGSHPHLAAGDLGAHFVPPVTEVMAPISAPSRAALIADNMAEVAAVKGHIGTRRVFRQDGAPDGRTIVVFGDSYSLGHEDYQGLSWFLAQIFHEVHFLWVPFGWDPAYLDDVGADLVVCQTAERFIGRVPNVSVDVMALARETVGRRVPLTEERIFCDRPDAG
jgi:alginate O-acetyltransferase complex protein AlgJ